MKYNQPFNETNPDAGYVNGNPGAGVEGSIPPAAQMEHPQREIVAVVAAAQAKGLDAPAASDLQQLLKAVRSGLLSHHVSTGTPDAIAITPNPSFPAVFEGMWFATKVPGSGASTITTPTFQANNVTRPIKLRDGSAPAAGDLVAGQDIVFRIDAALNARIQGPALSEIAALVTAPSVFNTIYNQFFATPLTYWRLDSPSTVVPSNALTTIGNYANNYNTVNPGTAVNASTGQVTIGSSDAGVYILTATNAMDVPTTEESIVIVVQRLGNIAISRGPYPSPGNNANDKSVTAVIRLQVGDIVSVGYIQRNDNNSPSNTLNQPLGHFGGVRVGG